MMWLDDTPRRAELEREFLRIHAGLKLGASVRAAEAVLALVGRADHRLAPPETSVNP